MSAYAELEAIAREINQLQEVQAISGWDEACMMPAGSGAGRSHALEIAKSTGLPDSLLNKAHQLIDDDQVDIQAAILSLQEGYKDLLKTVL